MLSVVVIHKRIKGGSQSLIKVSEHAFLCESFLIFSITASLLDSKEKRVFLEFIEKKQQCSLLCAPQ